MSPRAPTNEKERIIDEAMSLIERRVTEMGHKLRHTFVTFHLEDEEDGKNAATGFHFDGGEPEEAESELFAFLIAQAIGVGKEIGLDVRVMPVGRIGHD